MFVNKALEREVIRLSIQVNDLLSTLERLEKQWQAERKDYIDRIMALTQPASYRMFNPTPRTPPTSFRPPKPMFPGYRPNLRPPVQVPNEVSSTVPPSSSPVGLSNVTESNSGATSSNVE